MLDNTKFSTSDLQLINRMLLHPDFIVCKPRNNYYHSLCHKKYGIKLSFDFRKAVENKKVIGFGHLEINISPHYHFNHYKHNGNDFTPEECINTIYEILTYLEIQEHEFELLKVVNIEFGINLLPVFNIKDLIGGLLFHHRKSFKTLNFPYFKKTDTSSYKQIKAYAKGLQFSEYPQYEINSNMFRYEVKSKQSKNLYRYGIDNASDILTPKTYNTLGQELLNEWDHILIVNPKTSTDHLKPFEAEFISKAHDVNFWNEILLQKHRNTFNINKEKYYQLLTGNDNLHMEIKKQIIDKLVSFQKCANSTQGIPINREKYILKKYPEIR
ncbi:hypothetical protein CMU17_02400 [Elizabethkingia anophelis]|nr:hypothetical protein [Elizabethkingia anophelis]MDV3760285.1 hypothetical protein [Elizabethkingia anophelis]